MPPSHAFEAGHRHRDVRSGGVRAAVFGFSDGLVTNISLILGVAGAHPGTSFIRLTGVAGLFAGAFSMAAGEYVSMSTQRELFRRELDVEREALDSAPEFEHRELTEIFEKRGIDADTASALAEKMMADPETALETHAREELGIDPSNLGVPLVAGLSSLIAFSLGALCPLLPWFFAGGNDAVFWSIGIGAGVAFGVGLGVGLYTGHSPLRTAFRQLFVAAVAASVTYGIGRVVGATVHT